MHYSSEEFETIRRIDELIEEKEYKILLEEIISESEKRHENTPGDPSVHGCELDSKLIKKYGIRYDIWKNDIIVPLIRYSNGPQGQSMSDIIFESIKFKPIHSKKVYNYLVDGWSIPEKTSLSSF